MKYLYITIISFLILFSFIYITKENIKSVEYKSDFTLEECQKFQELAEKRTLEGKEIPRGLQHNLDTCAELFP